MARPTKLPGIYGVLAAYLSVSKLAEFLRTSPRTLNNWAHNVTGTPALAASILADLCKEYSVEPQIFISPYIHGYVASTPEGWIMWDEDYAKRKRYAGSLEVLLRAHDVDSGLISRPLTRQNGDASI